ncbi:hypothetical protein VTK73DRAFT_5417 [Phialemonium thermophilum]|uniref:Uncharacterized protein n=1 Tax=Phialemonium thermophilum TaxID=223376 RepID=A0ABR3WP14_9PEZI
MSAEEECPKVKTIWLGDETERLSHGTERNPILGNFVPVSETARSSSPSLKQHQKDENVYIHLSLTDSQLDTLATVLSTHTSPERLSRSGVKHANEKCASGNVPGSKLSPVSHSRSRSPVKPACPGHPAVGARFKSPNKNSGIHTSQEETHRVTFDAEHKKPAFSRNLVAASPNKGKPRSERNIRKAASDGSQLPLAERRTGGRPAAINVEVTRKYAKIRAQKNGLGPVIIHQPLPSQSPEKEEAHLLPTPGAVFARQTMEDRNDNYSYSSSIYTLDQDMEESLPHISPLHIRKGSESPHKPSVLRAYTDWRDGTTVPTTISTSLSARTPGTHASTEQKLGRQYRRQDIETPSAYTPLTLTPFFSNKEMPASRMSKKTMIGDNGWLERPTEPREKKVPAARKTGFLDSLKKKAKEMVDLTDLRVHASQRARPRANAAGEGGHGGERGDRLSVSLAPREQSLLYCELEYGLTCALNNYITDQFNAGRLDADKLKRVADSWQQKGRPRVIGFRYDLETQLELVRLHVGEFRFYGRPASTDRNAAGHSSRSHGSDIPAASNSPIVAHVTGTTAAATVLCGILDMMKVDARAIRIRTFCQPDTVIAKQLSDAQGLYAILGCSEPERVQLAEIVQFFRAALERERYYSRQQREARDGPKIAASANQGERNGRWHSSPTRGSTRTEDEA